MSDIADSGWTPQPVWQQLSKLTESNAPFVSCSPNPQGDYFQVKLRPLAWPKPGPQTLIVRMQTLGGSVPVIVSLLQGGTVIATRVTYPPGSFTDYRMQLSNGEIATITDYTNLSVRVQAGAPAVSSPCCAASLPGILFAHVSSADACSCLNGLSVPLIYTTFDNSWAGQLNISDSCGGPGLVLGIDLACFYPSQGCFGMRISGWCGNCGYNHNTYGSPGTPPGSCSCSPPSFMFGGLTIGFSPGCTACCSGAMTITITATQ